MPRVKVRAAFVMALATFAPPIMAHELSPSSAQLVTLPARAQSAAATVDAFHAALHRGDTRSAAGLLADDALIFEEGGVERTKAEYAAHHLLADATFSQSVSSTIIRRSGRAEGRFAWIASEGRTTGSYKGKHVDQLTTETMLLRQIGGVWKIVHVHWSSALKR
jgi:ketosteroid isomerase-like protein